LEAAPSGFRGFLFGREDGMDRLGDFIDNAIEIFLDIITLRVFCSHEWKNSGWSYVRCKKCDARRYDPKKANSLIWDKCNDMVESGIWDRGEVEKNFALHLGRKN
jgi:hypothetical protein